MNHFLLNIDFKQVIKTSSHVLRVFLSILTHIHVCIKSIQRMAFLLSLSQPEKNREFKL